MTTIYLLFKETSDQYGTSEFVGAFSERWRAERHQFDHLKQSRCSITECVVDEKDREPYVPKYKLLDRVFP